MPEQVRRLAGLVEEVRETVKLLETFLDVGSRLEFVQAKAEELMRVLSDALMDPSLPDDLRRELEDLSVRAKSIAERARRKVEEVNSSWRDVERRSAEGLRRTF
ncbi:MAG: hypothetical protein RQ949_00050 [Candidatus Calditenuis sp.]|nr:hypothetical protein [Candidatus Calditenuis sp.]